MTIMKKYLFFAAAFVALASCSSDDLVGENSNSPNPNPAPASGEKAIVFNSGANAITRADYTGSEAAGLLNNKFIVGGFKGTGTSTVFDGSGSITTEGVPATDMVYDNYQVNWVTNTANTTTSNTNDWEYVGLPFLAPSALVNSQDVLQSIKYWDYSAAQYDFIAYSTSNATVVTGDDEPTTGQVHVTAITPSTAGAKATGAYKLKGDAAGLKKCYIADMVTSYRDAVTGTPSYPSDYPNTVQFKFRSLSAKVRVALYETVPGYSVKNVMFYEDADDASPSATAKLFTTDGSGQVFNESGTYTVYFPTIGSSNRANTDYNKAHVAFTPASSAGTATIKDFGALTGDLTNGTFATSEGKEAAITGSDKGYLGRSSNAATYAGTRSPDNYYTIVLPNENGAVLNLKVNYTLVSTDGSGEAINVTGATAQVPAVYASWKSGYAYTYIFKISQNSNGYTNPSAGPAGLYPITFDAVVMNSEVDGIQETITTVAEPSITTYAKGQIVTTNNEYTTGSTIYAVVENGTKLTVGTNANLYTVTLESGAAQTINEASVANAIKNGGASSPFVVTDANGKKMTVTSDAGLTAVTKIDADDSPDGNAITVNGAKFTAGAAGTIYAFEYIEFTASTPVADTNLASGGYYTVSDGVYTVCVSGTANGTTTYYKPGPKHYKIIKIKE